MKLKLPRKCSFFGCEVKPHYGALDTWLEPEEFCYPRGGMTRRAHAINIDTGHAITVKCGIPDTFFSIPCSGGFLTLSHGGVFLFHPTRKKEETT